MNYEDWKKDRIEYDKKNEEMLKQVESLKDDYDKREKKREKMYDDSMKMKSEIHSLKNEHIERKKKSEKILLKSKKMLSVAEMLQQEIYDLNKSTKKNSGIEKKREENSNNFFKKININEISISDAEGNNLEGKCFFKQSNTL